MEPAGAYPAPVRCARRPRWVAPPPAGRLTTTRASDDGPQSARCSGIRALDGVRALAVALVLADHGEMLGERGLWYKMSFFEPACRIPLFIHAPRLFSARSVSQSVSLVDLLPTLLELANDGKTTPIAGQLDGHSLLPHLQGSGGHDEVLGEYLAEGAIAPIVMRREGFLLAGPDRAGAVDPIRQVMQDQGTQTPSAISHEKQAARRRRCRRGIQASHPAGS